MAQTKADNYCPLKRDRGINRDKVFNLLLRRLQIEATHVFQNYRIRETI